MSGDSDPTLTNVDPPMAPITANTPLPPVNPLPLASQPASESAAPIPAAASQPDPSEQPATLPPPPPFTSGPAQPFFRRASGAGVSSTWAVYSTFALMFTSLILIVIMAVAAAEISKKPDVLFWIIALTFVVNIVYAFVVFALAQSGSGQPFRLPFTNSRRGP
jgi:hypothetical protein